MTREQLEHAIRAACEVAEDSELWIFGSQSILGRYPDATAELRTSIELDVQPKNRSDKIDLIDALLGELSLFHQTHGFYVHGLLIEEAVKLPPGWQQRVTRVFGDISTNGKTGWCIEAHDLSASKLVAFREKDRNFVRILLIEGMINMETLIERIHSLEIYEKLRERLVQWAQYTAEEL
ncbi:MAG: hypothetical protein PVI42_07840 [Desulfobacterales bacterium]|jgi:hypothetical protein